MLKIDGIYKYFDGKEILKEINLEIKKGEKLVIIGPSGSGKSTLLRAAFVLELKRDDWKK